MKQQTERKHRQQTSAIQKVNKTSKNIIQIQSDFACLNQSYIKMKYQAIINNSAESKQVRFTLPGKSPSLAHPLINKQYSEVVPDSYRALAPQKSSQVFEAKQRLSDFSILAHSYTSQSIQQQDRARTSLGMLGHSDFDTLHIMEEDHDQEENRESNMEALAAHQAKSVCFREGADLDRAPEGHQKAPTRKKSRNRVSNKHSSSHKGPLVHKPKTSRDEVAREGANGQTKGQEKVLVERKQRMPSKGGKRRSKKSQDVKKAAKAEAAQGSQVLDAKNQKQKKSNEEVASQRYKVSRKGVQIFNVHIADLASERGRNQRDHGVLSFRQKIEQESQGEYQPLPQEPLTHRVVSNRKENLHLVPQEISGPAMSHRDEAAKPKKAEKRGSQPHLPASRNIEKQSLQSDCAPPLVPKVAGILHTDKKKERGLSRNLQSDCSEWHKSKEEKLKKLNEELSDLKNFISKIGRRAEPPPGAQKDGLEKINQMDQKLQQIKQQHQSIAKNKRPNAHTSRASSKMTKKQNQKVPGYSISPFEDSSHGDQYESDSARSLSDRKIQGILAYCQDKYGHNRPVAQDEKDLKERPWQRNMKKGAKAEKKTEPITKDLPLQKRASIVAQNAMFDINMLSKNIPKPKVGQKQTSVLELNVLNEKLLSQRARAAETYKPKSPKISGRKISRDQIVVKTSPDVSSNQGSLPPVQGPTAILKQNFIAKDTNSQKSQSLKSDNGKYDLPRQIEKVEKMTMEMDKSRRQVNETEKRMNQQKDAFIITFNQNVEMRNNQEQQNLSGYQRVRQMSGQSQAKKHLNLKKKSKVQFMFSESQKRRSRTPELLPFGRQGVAQRSAEEIVGPHLVALSRRRSGSPERLLLFDRIANIQKQTYEHKARSVSPSETKGALSRNIISHRLSHQSQENRNDNQYLSLPKVIRNSLHRAHKSSRGSVQNKKRQNSNSKITPTKKAKKSLNADLSKVNSIVKSNLKKHQELDNQKMEERFLQALQYQDKLQRMRVRNQEIRKKNEEASRSRSRSRSRSPQVKDGSPESNGQSKGLKLKRQLMEKYSYNKLRQLEQKQKMLDDMKQKPLNLQKLARDVVDPVGHSMDNKDFDPNYADVQSIILTSRYKQVRAVHTHREKVDESAQLIMKKPGEEQAAKDKLVTLEVASSRSDVKDGRLNGPRGEGASSKMKQSLEQLVQKQKLRRQEIERARRLHNEVQRNRISENLKKLEVDIEKLKKREQKRSKSQRKYKHWNKSRVEVEQTEKKRSKSPEKGQKDKEKNKEQDKNVKLLLQKKKIQPNNKNYSLQVSKNTKNRKKSSSPSIHGARSVSNTRHKLSQMQETRTANQDNSSSVTHNQKSKKVAISVIPLSLKQRGQSRSKSASKSKSKSKSKSGSRSRSKSPTQGKSLLRENSRTKGPSRSRSGSPSPPPVHKPSHPYLSHLAGERAFHSQQISHRSMGNLKTLSTRQKIKQIISNQKYILNTKMKMIDLAQRSPKLKGQQQNLTTSTTQLLATKPDEMKSLQALALNLFNLSEQQLKQERKDKQRKRAAMQKEELQGRQSREQKHRDDDDQIMNLDLKSLPKTRKSSKDDVKASYATLNPADDSSNNEISLSKMYKQISMKQSKKGSDSTSRSPKFKELTLNQEELNDFQPYENRTPASSKRSVSSILPAQIFAIPEGPSSVTLFPKQANQGPAYQSQVEKTPTPAQGADTTQATIQSDKIGPFESSEAAGDRRNLGPPKHSPGFLAQHQNSQDVHPRPQSDIKAKIQNLLQDASSFEVIVTLNNAAIQIQRWYRKHRQEKQAKLREPASPLRNSVLRRPLSMTPLSLPRHHQPRSSMRSPSVDVNIQSSIQDQVEEQPKDLDLGLADHIPAANVQDTLNPIKLQRRSPEQQVIRTHREPISNNNSGMKGIRPSRNDAAEQEDDFGERRVNHTEQRGARTESKRDLELANAPASAVAEHRNQRFFETSLPTEDVDLTSRIEMIDEAISQARHQEVINEAEGATDRQISEAQIVDSLHGPAVARDRQRLLSVAQQMDSRQSPQSVLLGEGDRIQTISVVGSVVDVVEDSRSHGASAASKRNKAGSDLGQHVEHGEDDAAEGLSDFDMKQFEIRSLCEMLQSETSSDAKDLQKQEIKQRKGLKQHTDKTRQHHTELKQEQAGDGEARNGKVDSIAKKRILSKDEESKSEDIIQQISLRSLNIDGLDSNEKILEFTAHITSPDDVDLAKQPGSKCPETPREKAVEKYPGQLEAPNLERLPHTSRNDYQPHSHRHMISDHRSSQISMNLQNIQPINRPSVDSKFLPKDVARISKISKNLGDHPVSQQVSHRSFLNHAKNLFPDEPAFAQDDRVALQHPLKVQSHSSKHASQRSEQQNLRNLEKSVKTPDMVSFDDQRALQIEGMSAEGQNEKVPQYELPLNEKPSSMPSNRQPPSSSKPVEQVPLPRIASQSSAHNNSQNRQDMQILDSQPTLDGQSLQNEDVQRADSSESKISKSFYQNLELFPQIVTTSSPERTGNSKLQEAIQSPTMANEFHRPSSNDTSKTQIKELQLASQIEPQKAKISSATTDPAPPKAHRKDKSSVTEGQLNEMVSAYVHVHTAQIENVEDSPGKSAPSKLTPKIEKLAALQDQQESSDGNLLMARRQHHSSGQNDDQVKKREENGVVSNSEDGPKDNSAADYVGGLSPPRYFADLKPSGQAAGLHRRGISASSVCLAVLQRTQPIKPFVMAEPTQRLAAENDRPGDSNRSEARSRDVLSKTQLLPRRRSFDEPFPSSQNWRAARSRSNQKQIAQSPKMRSPGSEPSFQRETVEMIKKVNQSVNKSKKIKLSGQQPLEGSKNLNAVDADAADEPAKPADPSIKAVPSQESPLASPVAGNKQTSPKESSAAKNEKKNADLKVAEGNQQELDAINQLQINESKSLLIDVASEKVIKDQTALISGRTSSSQQESQYSNAVSQGTLEKRREIGEELERVLGQQIFEQDLDQVLANVLRRDNLTADKKESIQQKYNEKIPAPKEQEEIPEQISLKQAQIQKELDELQQLQGKKEEAKEPEEQPTTDGQSPARSQRKAHQQLIAGIDTSLETVESYVEDIFQQIRERGPQFLNAFLTPIYHQPLDELHILRQAQLEYQLNGSQGSFYHNMFENEQLNASLLCILNVQLYLTLEKERESVIKEAIEQIKQQSEEEINEEELADMISEADHIHNKAIFDAVNEAMNLVRPYGKQGEPMPWSRQGRKNSFMQVQNNIQSIYKTLERVLHQVKYYVLSWANTRAGSVHHSSEIEQDPKAGSQENQIRQILQDQERQKIIEEIINQEILEGQNHDQEQQWNEPNQRFMAQVKLELADHVFDSLVHETIGCLNAVSHKQQQNVEPIIRPAPAAQESSDAPAQPIIPESSAKQAEKQSQPHAS